MFTFVHLQSLTSLLFTFVHFQSGCPTDLVWLSSLSSLHPCLCLEYPWLGYLCLSCITHFFMLPSQLCICRYCHHPTHMISAPRLNLMMLLTMPNCQQQKRTGAESENKQMPYFLCWCYDFFVQLIIYSPMAPWLINQPLYWFSRSSCFRPSADNESKKGLRSLSEKECTSIFFLWSCIYFFNYLLPTQPCNDWYISPQADSGDFAAAFPLQITKSNRSSEHMVRK